MGLLPGVNYRFRVSAVNRQGESDPAEAAPGEVAFRRTGEEEDAKIRAT